MGGGGREGGGGGGRKNGFWKFGMVGSEEGGNGQTRAASGERGGSYKKRKVWNPCIFASKMRKKKIMKSILLLTLSV